MQVWFNTLNEALKSEGLEGAWILPINPIGRGETFKWTWQTSQSVKQISVYRDYNGRFKKPVIS